MAASPCIYKKLNSLVFVHPTNTRLAATEGITIGQAKYKVGAPGTGNLLPVEMEADLSGNYISLAKFINALERDQMFFIINSITLGGEQQGPVKLNMKLETYLKAGTR